MLAERLSGHPEVQDKVKVQQAYGHAMEVSGKVRLGDDCAAILNPSGSGYLLFAAEGMTETFVENDPWFAGYSAVMMNLSDVAAMGGRPVAITDILWTSTEKISSAVWDGMQAAAQAYGVPIVGGHTSRTSSGKAMLGAAVLGHAGECLITSFDAKPGDRLMLVVDMHGSFRGNQPFWNASTVTPPERLRSDLELLPSLAEKGLCRAGKDIGNGGVIGTLAMLCECSGVGAVMDLEDLPCPMDVEIERWLTCIPSFGYLLAVPPDDVGSAMSHFTTTRITCREIGRFTGKPDLVITAGDEFAKLDFRQRKSQQGARGMESPQQPVGAART